MGPANQLAKHFLHDGSRISRIVYPSVIGERAFIRSVQFEELAPCMSHAADLRHAEFKAGLVAAKIVADQFATPALQEVASMHIGAATLD